MSARVVRGKFVNGKFEQDTKGDLFAVYRDTTLMDVRPTEDQADAMVENIQTAERRELLEKNRELLAKEEAEERERRQRGIVEPVLDGKDVKLMERVIKLAIIARTVSRTKITVKVMDDQGKPTDLVDRIGNEDMILMALLNQRLNSEDGR